jgi:exonuclease VII small subunit
MKNKILLSFISISLLAAPAVSLAQSSNASTKANAASTTTKTETAKSKTPTIKDTINAQKENLQNSVTERRETVTNKIQERTSEFVKKIIERFNAAANRLDVLAQRIESRISKLKAANISTTEAEKLMVTAKNKIKSAKASITLIVLGEDTASTTASMASTTTTQQASSTIDAIREAFDVVTGQIQKAKDDLKAAQAALVDVVNSLKPGDNKLKNATSTATTTTNSD